MKWYNNLYVDEKFTDSLEKIKKKVSNSKYNKNIYLICLSPNSTDLFDIISADLAMYITWRQLYVIGISSSKNAAVDLTRKIICDVYKQNGSYNIKEFFTQYDSGNNIFNT